MSINIQSYLLALDVFALLALVMVVTAAPGQTKGDRNRLLLALFALVVVRSAALIIQLAFDNALPKLFDSLEILSLLCFVLILVKPAIVHSRLWWTYARLGLVVWALILVVFWFTPVSWQPLVLLLVLGSLPLILSHHNKPRWSYAVAPLLLGFAAFLSLEKLKLNHVAQFLTLMAYGALVYAIFVEAVIKTCFQQQAAESLGAETRRAHSERARLREVSSALSVADSPTEALAHAAETIANNTSSDQIIILALLPAKGNTGHVVAAYSADGAIHYTSRDDTTFNLSDAPLLLDVLETQRYVVIANSAEDAGLGSLYNLWGEVRVGPVLLQPLLLKPKVVGILVVCNPISGRSISGDDIRLAQSIAPQLAGMVVYQWRYQNLELQTEDFAARLQLAQGELLQLSNIIEAISDGVVVSDIDGKIQLVNIAAQRILGKSETQLLGQPINTIYGDIASDEAIEKLAVEFSRSKQPLSTYFERDDLAVQGRLIPLRNKRQEWMGIVALLWDVSTEVAAGKTKREFVETISRELRMPLTTIRGYADLMMAGATGNLDIQQHHFMSVIRGGIDKVIQIINNVSYALDRETDTSKLNTRPVDIGQMIVDATQAAVTSTTFKKPKITTDIASDIPPIQADPVRLRRVLDNLLSNACRATDKRGQILLRAWVQSGGLNSHQSSHLIISVSDRGRVVAADAQKWISNQSSQPFSQLDHIVDSARVKCQEVKEIVEAHGGRVWIEAFERGSGVIHIALPVTR